MQIINRLNNSRPANLLENTREVLRDSEEQLDGIKQIIKQSLLLLERGKEIKSILPGPSSCDYTSEDRSRIKESETWAKRAKTESNSGGGGKMRGPRRSRRGNHPYSRGGMQNSRFSAPFFPYGQFTQLPGQQFPQQFQQPRFAAAQGGLQQHGQQNGPNNPPVCFYCGRAGHRRKECVKRMLDGAP